MQEVNTLLRGYKKRVILLSIFFMLIFFGSMFYLLYMVDSMFVYWIPLVSTMFYVVPVVIWGVRVCFCGFVDGRCEEK